MYLHTNISHFSFSIPFSLNFKKLFSIVVFEKSMQISDKCEREKNARKWIAMIIAIFGMQVESHKLFIVLLRSLLRMHYAVFYI